MKERFAKAKNGTGPQGGIFVPPDVGYDTISMPGNQGGSNWHSTAADPLKGMVFVVGVNQVALLQLFDVTKRGGGAGRFGGGGGQLNPNVAQGTAAFQNKCQVCHGPDLLGTLPSMPSLVGVTDRMGEDAIKAILTGGRGNMRPVSDISEQEMNAVIAYLSMFGAAGRRGGGGGGGGRRGGGPNIAYPALGAPVTYESKGRQYFVMSGGSLTGGRGRGAGGGAPAGAAGAPVPAPPVDPNVPMGTIAFSLPVKK